MKAEARVSVFVVVLVAFEAKDAVVDVEAVGDDLEMAAVAYWVAAEVEEGRRVASTTVDYPASSPAASADVEVVGKAEGRLRWEELAVEHLEVFASVPLLVDCRTVDSACMRSFVEELADAEAVPDSSSPSAHVQDAALLCCQAVTYQAVRVKVLSETAA